MTFINSKPKRITAARLLAGYSLAAMGEKSGVSASTIFKLEQKAKKVRPSTAKSIADAIGVPVEDLFEIVEEEE